MTVVYLGMELPDMGFETDILDISYTRSGVWQWW
ncbi:hypothetical protein SAMN06266787_1092 [Halorubrum ezzemoulense]|uniref:Uncharacterized protein n=1 Tax=Halorubrum ezzemoulense TaxID=337243 RepID=A0A238Y6U9_HALEZ|nr:hypothetical protein SAMN06266787_1092 [Halorubrum ezzemoulense]